MILCRNLFIAGNEYRDRWGIERWTTLGNLVKGNIYLVEEERLVQAPQVFLKETKNKRCLVMTRQPTDILETDEDHARHMHYRFGLLPAPDTISPHNISTISYLLSDFLADRGPGVILIEGLEYLATQNSFQTVLRFFQFIYDKAAGSNCVIIVSLNPLAFSLKEFHLLRNETTRVPESCFEDDLAVDQLSLLKVNP